MKFIRVMAIVMSFLFINYWAFYGFSTGGILDVMYGLAGLMIMVANIIAFIWSKDREVHANNLTMISLGTAFLLIMVAAIPELLKDMS